MIDIIIEALVNSPSITQYVPADNIFPVFRLQQSTLPAITIQLVGTDPQHTHDTHVDMDINMVEITTFHESPKAAWRVATEIRSRLQGFNGRDIEDIIFDTQATDIFESTEVHSISQRFECFTTRPR